MALQLVVKSSESKLMQNIGELRAQPSGWQAVHFHLSHLLEEYKSEYQIKIAINLIHDLLKNHDGSIYVLADNSIIVLCHRLEKALLEKLIFQLRYLYMDDPLCYNELGQENPDFCSVYDLKNDWQTVDRLCANYMALITRNQPLVQKSGQDVYLASELIESRNLAQKFTMTGTQGMGTSERQRQFDDHVPKLSSEKLVEKEDTIFDLRESNELSASRLASVEQVLKTIDLRAVTRRQPVCAVLSDMKVRRVFDELYIHIAHLRRTFKSDVDFFSNRWLFKYLTLTLDRRMLDMINNNPGSFLATPISINLNVETLLSPWFASFDAKVKPEAKVSVVIEVPVVDLFSDMGAFKTAMKEVQKLGYRVCLDGLSTESFMSINREKIGLDLIKIQWNADSAADLKSKSNSELIEAVRVTGNNRLILCRCDNRSALEYGTALGISLFQGRYLDNILNPASRMEN